MGDGFAVWRTIAAGTALALTATPTATRSAQAMNANDPRLGSASASSFFERYRDFDFWATLNALALGES
jgi:hypothetical protein